MDTHKVFVNRIINMRKIKLIGLDMDHTLIRYNSKNFESLVYDLVKERLAESFHYPEEIKKFKFNFDDAIRGLVIDSKNGNILKLSRYGAIRLSYHGTKQISFSDQKKIYRSIYVDLGDPNYMAIDTSFSIAFCILYGQLVDLKDTNPDKMPSYQAIAQDVQYCVDKVHSDGTLKNIIIKNLKKYVIREKEVVEGLKHFIRYGKKIFILTNSEYSYSKLLLDYALSPFLDKGEHWQSLFEFVITLANKPRFFYDNLRFLSVNPENGTMTNVHGPIVPGVYQGGNAKKFTEDLGVGGDEILYIGDHIYGDILRLKKDCNWRTALVVEELGEEIASQIRALPIEKKIVEAMSIKKELEQKYVDLCTRSIDESSQQYDQEIHDLQLQISTVDLQISRLLQEQNSFYNPKWERVFRAGAEESYFAYQVDRFACIYMEKLSDLLEHSPMTYFRANRRLLAHDIDI
ncbi:TPA: 5' nucleotidase [Legionella pneumophila]|uniref:5' nucleotidase n=1 Tax=Legionella pneumophila subsp. pneumophila TaxID=91891 RepID=A0A3A6VDI9_LEGPN|nr:5' nucleotidase [Legionella pneumophila]ERH46566.1 cytochrome C oxidase subunit II [Legionella pneumophila str. Leg01/11]ERI48660.1 cytochrome C oxidase subunit II [Legionella pneumophila str. Leg01/20]AMV12800.1 5' nucleotidase family protein [Legionella pneumophila]ANN91179.1 5'-nucleotidase [Legionella pneumophila]ANN94280.1 5'-nucleotidase [Legionella pneumophila]